MTFGDNVGISLVLPSEKTAATEKLGSGSVLFRGEGSVVLTNRVTVFQDTTARLFGTGSPDTTVGGGFAYVSTVGGGFAHVSTSGYTEVSSNSTLVAVTSIDPRTSQNRIAFRGSMDERTVFDTYAVTAEHGFSSSYGTSLLVFSTSESAAFTNRWVGTQPEIDQRYSWRERQKLLRAWRGETRDGEAPRLSDEALQIAETIANYAEQRLAAAQVHLATVLVPMHHGGVQVEWTLRGTSVLHVEVEVPPAPSGSYGLLRTRESLEGEVFAAYELTEATVSEVLAELEKLIFTARRWTARALLAAKVA